MRQISEVAYLTFSIGRSAVLWRFMLLLDLGVSSFGFLALQRVSVYEDCNDFPLLSSSQHLSTALAPSLLRRVSAVRQRDRQLAAERR